MPVSTPIFPTVGPTEGVPVLNGQGVGLWRSSCRSAAAYAESAKANGIEPFAYLQHVLVQLPYLGKTHSHEELESLMPWSPYIQQNFAIKNSNAYTNTYLN